MTKKNLSKQMKGRLSPSSIPKTHNIETNGLKYPLERVISNKRTENLEARLKRILNIKPDWYSIVKYKPRTNFLKDKIAKANLRNEKQRNNIATLCKIEDLAYRHQVKHERKRWYGSYQQLYGEQFSVYRQEYFEILKELSHKDYIRVLANEITEPDHYRGWRHGKPICLPAGISKEDFETMIEIKDRFDKKVARERQIKKMHDKVEKTKYLKQLYELQIRNSNLRREENEGNK